MMKKITKEIDEKAYYSILFAYYQNLLTEKQKDTFISYYEEDYSLGEIADELGVSRNAIWDSLKKTCKVLEEYEEKLKLYDKDLQLSLLIDDLKQNINNPEKLNKIIDSIQSLMEETE